jgi:hypothetical protein
MKKYIISGIAVLAIAAVAAWNVGLNLNSQNSHNLSDIQLANVEALAQENGGHNCPGRHCSWSDVSGSCSACCPFGKSAVCNTFGCGCS